MGEADLYAFLKEQFVATFLDELIPGMLHNFANPLNGIMGRSKLMQRRLADFIKKMEELCPEAADRLAADRNKLMYDINAISTEAEKFFEMFRMASGKFYALGAEGTDELNLSALVEAELGFGNFYMDFKHDTPKKVQLDPEAPSVRGVTAHHSLALWLLIQEAAKNARAKADPLLTVSTTHDDRWVIVTIGPLGSSLMPGWEARLASGEALPAGPPAVTEEQRRVLCALMLMARSVRGTEITLAADGELLDIRMPHRPWKA